MIFVLIPNKSLNKLLLSTFVKAFKFYKIPIVFRLYQILNPNNYSSQKLISDSKNLWILDK